MTAHLDFAPDAERAVLINRAMHRELGASLTHIRERAAGILDFDEAAIAAVVLRLEQGLSHRPSLFADYYEPRASVASA
jgi:hypothetical protein